MLLKKEFPEIKGTYEAFRYATERRLETTITLLEKEFPEIKKSYGENQMK